MQGFSLRNIKSLSRGIRTDMFQCYSYCAGEFDARITKHWMSTQEVRSKHKNFCQVVSCCASSSPKWGKFTSLLYFLPRTAFILILAYYILQSIHLPTVEPILKIIKKFWRVYIYMIHKDHCSYYYNWDKVYKNGPSKI